MNSRLVSSPKVTRRNFLQAFGVGLAGLAFLPWSHLLASVSLPDLPPFPSAERLGRALEPGVKLYARPDDQSRVVGELAEDSVVVWLKEVTGFRRLWQHQRFVETPQGYVYAPNLQPVRYQPNAPLRELTHPEGMWVEVTVPYVDLLLANPPARSPWLEYSPAPRLYYSQILWVDEIKVDDQGRIWYHLIEKFGSYGDEFWAAGEAFRPLEAEEITPLHADAQDKLVVVDLTYQTLSCYEGQSEVYFCRVSTGGKVEARDKPAKWATPPGKHTIWRKMVSVHMSGGATGTGYDLPGIGWTTLFASAGMAIHSTFWHNSFGVPRSHGCVNALPEDAKWVFCWTLPVVDLLPGDVTVKGQSSTRVLVTEG